MMLRSTVFACFFLSVAAFAKGPPKVETTVLEAPEFTAQPDGSSELIFVLRGAPAQPSLQNQGGRWLLQFALPVSLGVQAKRPLLTEAFGGSLQSVRMIHTKKSVQVALTVNAGSVPILSADAPSGDTVRVHVLIPAVPKSSSAALPSAKE